MSTCRNMLRWLTVVAAMCLSVNAVAIQNGVVGEPEIECTSDGVLVTVNTQAPFEGRVFVKVITTFALTIRTCTSHRANQTIPDAR